MSLLALYTCDGDLNDTSGNARHATPVGVTFTSPGMGFDEAALYDGIDDYGNMPSTGINQDNLAFSCGGWVNFTSTPVAPFAETIMGNGSSAIGQTQKFAVLFRRQPDGKLLFGIWKSQVWAGYILSDNAIIPSADTWYHIFGTYDGSRTVGGFKFYIDGVEITAKSNNGAFGVIPTTYDSWFLGNNEALTTDLPGKQNDMRLYDTALTAEEVAALVGGGNPWNYYAQQMED